jgi:putative FmdB family regulatory protein
MPLYDYSCRKCNEVFEVLVRGKTVPTCPKCKSEDLERLMSLPRVSSETTRQLAMTAAKKRDAAQAKDNMHEQLKYEQSHDRHG